MGGAGLLTSVLIILCDLMDSRTRGTVCLIQTASTCQTNNKNIAVYQGILGAALGLATIVGPLLGGFLADHNQWR